MKNHVRGLRARHDGWTPERQRLFLETLANTGSSSKAARATGLSRASAYALRNHPGAAAFAAAWFAAVEVFRRSKAPPPAAVSRPIIRRGRIVAIRTIYAEPASPRAMREIRAEVARLSRSVFNSTLSTSAPRARGHETHARSSRLSTSSRPTSGLASIDRVP